MSNEFDYAGFLQNTIFLEKSQVDSCTMSKQHLLFKGFLFMTQNTWLLWLLSCFLWEAEDPPQKKTRKSTKMCGISWKFVPEKSHGTNQFSHDLQPFGPVKITPKTTETHKFFGHFGSQTRNSHFGSATCLWAKCFFGPEIF